MGESEDAKWSAVRSSAKCRKAKSERPLHQLGLGRKMLYGLSPLLVRKAKADILFLSTHPNTPQFSDGLIS